MKNAALFAVPLLVLPAAIAWAQLSDDEQPRIAEQFRRSMGLEAMVKKIKAGEVDPKRLAVIRAMLSATSEVHIHQQRGAIGNTVYLHPEGHQEAVYGPDGTPVTDGINDGSYNYFHPTEDAARHYFFDIHPWIVFGNSRTDPTTRQERVASFLADLEAGIRLASLQGDYPAVDVRSLRFGEPETYAIFLNALREGEANELFAAIEGQEILRDEKRAAILRKIERAFQSLYVKIGRQ